MYAPGESLPFLGQEVEVGGVQPGHHAPAVAPPSLHHHEQVEVCAAGAVIVLFKVIPRVFHESFQFAGQQHLGEYGAVVVGRLVGGVVSDGERDAGGGVRRVVEAERQLHRFEGRVLRLDAPGGDSRPVVVVAVDEGEAVGVDSSSRVEEGDLVHARGEPFQGYFDGGLPAVRRAYLREIPADTRAEHLQAEPAFRVSAPPDGDAHEAVVLRDGERVTLRLRLGEFRLVVLPAMAEDGLVALSLRRGEGERAAPSVFSPCPCCRLPVLVEDVDVGLQVASVPVVQLEGDAVGHSGNEVSALGVELQIDHGLPPSVLVIPPHGPEGHVLGIPPRLFRFVEHGEDARIELVVVAEEVPCHPFVVEHVLGVGRMRVLVFAEVEHPACVCPQLVVSGIERVGEDEGPVRRSVGHVQLLAFDEVSVGREEFHVEDAAQVGEPPPVGPCDVALVPHGVAHEVTGVVHVEIDFFLGQRGAEPCDTGGEGVDANLCGAGHPAEEHGG